VGYFVIYRRHLTVNHDILKKSLEFYGITGKFGDLIKSRRFQSVNLDPNDCANCSLSRWAEVKAEVPQGSILWPLFFLLYINDITKGSNIFLYANDTSIIVTNPEYNGYKLIMNKMFQEVNKWFKSNLLTLNFKKLTVVNQDEIDKCSVSTKSVQGFIFLSQLFVKWRLQEGTRCMGWIF
jgi:hypothetical protein